MGRDTKSHMDTHKETDDPLYRIRHSLAHVMAQAVLEVRPEAKLGFGPPVDSGFYYDFDFGKNPLGEADLQDIEKRMRRIIRQGELFEQETMDFSEAKARLEALNQGYKIEYATELVEKGIAEDGKLSFYTSGPFIDMCEGPHVPTTKQIPEDCFKLDRIAGSYWRGDEHKPMLTRIYGLAFQSAEDLKDFIRRRELAMQRDHRKLGVELELFAIDEEIGSGLPLWLPKGTAIRDELERWAREQEFVGGYQRVETPSITRAQLYFRSGHLPYYAESMFPPMDLDEEDKYYLRPMNCPHHHKIYSLRPRSYRELPLRLSEYGDDFRYEKHGSLSGLLRVRAMCMNDAHIYCTPEQVKPEFKRVIQMYRYYYDHLRLEGFRVRLSLHDQNSAKFVQNEAEWVRSETIVREVLDEMGITYEEEAGEAAFYGPKMDIQVKNVVGREETLSTCQLDFVMPERFDLTYVGADGSQHRPYIIHRAPLGTHERMISFLIEFFGGAFPTWLSPVQVRIVPVSAAQAAYAHEIEERLVGHLIRAEVDDSSETFGKRLRTAIKTKIPNIWIVGNEEVEARRITWRRYCVETQTKASLDSAMGALVEMSKTRLMDNYPDVALPLPA